MLLVSSYHLTVHGGKTSSNNHSLTPGEPISQSKLKAHILTDAKTSSIHFGVLECLWDSLLSLFSSLFFLWPSSLIKSKVVTQWSHYHLPFNAAVLRATTNLFTLNHYLAFHFASFTPFLTLWCPWMSMIACVFFYWVPKNGHACPAVNFIYHKNQSPIMLISIRIQFERH